MDLISLFVAEIFPYMHNFHRPDISPHYKSRIIINCGIQSNFQIYDESCTLDRIDHELFLLEHRVCSIAKLPTIIQELGEQTGRPHYEISHTIYQHIL